jgi:tetratricopeptide (TPR) repeat protein
MNVGAPTGLHTGVVGEPEICDECQTASRLTNGLCLACLLRGALDVNDAATGKEAFKEVLAGVRSSNGDWFIAEHEILEEIARGGMGVVYQAREPHSGRIVALKCVLGCQGDSDHVVARFRREAETAARLEHPNIVPIYQVGETADGFPYYTMKYAAAGSLLAAQDTLRPQPHLSVALMLKVARAIQYAHQKGVLHRDLKPGNILLDNHGEPLVSDFGMARCETGSYLTRPLDSFGTPGYIAPEQADGPATRLTPAADVYALGAILFELLTGRTPFVGGNAFAVMKQSADKSAPKVRTFAPHVDRDLEIICARCLEREPADRYPSVAALADDLQHWLDDQPIAARSPNIGLSVRRWVRLNRKLVVVLGLLLVFGAGSVLWQVRSQKMELAFKESLIAARSVVILPLFDLDTVREDPGATRWVADSLSKQFESLGGGRVRASSVPGRSRLGEIQKAVRDARARTALTGTVRTVEGKRRVALRLLDPADGQPLLATVLEQGEAPSNSSEKQRNWGREIVAVLEAGEWSDVLDEGLDPGMRNEDVAETMRSARAWMTTYSIAGLDHAIALLNKAVSQEPNSALAHTYLAMAASSRVHLVSDPAYLELASSEAQKALALQPGLVEAHRALAGVHFQQGRFPEALEETMRTMEMGGVQYRTASFAGGTLDILGRPDRSLKWYEVASRLQEAPGEAEPMIGDSWARLVEDGRAFRAYDRAMELQAGSWRGAMGKCYLLVLRGEFQAAQDVSRAYLGKSTEFVEAARTIALLEFFSRNYAVAEERYEELAKNDADGGGSFYGAVSYRSALGRIKQALGKNDEALRLLQMSLETETSILKRQPGHPEAAYRLAAAEASLDLSEPALEHLAQAISFGWLDYRSLEKDPRFDSLRSSPKYADLVKQLSERVAALRSKAE